jgi:hypothetical protein
MLREHQVRYLLASSEQAVGKRFELLRKHLASRDPVPYIWEVVVIDALLQSGAHVAYEAATANGLTPDLLVTAGGARAFWLEAAYVRDRFAADNVRLDTLIRRLTREAAVRGIPSGSIGYRADGNPSPAGFRLVLPAEHDFPRFFKLPELVSFFRAIREAPDVAVTRDLRSAGYTITFSYVPPTKGGPAGSGGWVSEVPRRVEEHSVYRALCYKGRKYSKIPTNEPIVICIGSEDSHAASSFQSLNAVQLRDAVSEAFRRRPALSAAFVVPIETNNSIDNYGRIARPQFFVNPWAERPLSDDEVNSLRRIDFNLVEYGGAWNEWNRRETIAERRKGLGGRLELGGSPLVKDGTRIEVSAEVLLQILAGDMSEADFIREYRLTPPTFTSAWNPFRVAWEEGRCLRNVTVVPGDPRKRESARVRFDFGAPQEMLLQVRRNDGDSV